MSRRIVSGRGQPLLSAGPVDGYFDKVVKYIPADVIAAWTAATGLIDGAVDVPSDLLLWLVFAVGAIFTAIWTFRQTQEPPKGPAVTQTVIATGAFVIWVAALGGPFATLGGWSPVYGSLLLIVYTLGVGLVSPPEG
ncbi:MAG: hypothetical protein GXY76_06600 [Chloroflexi bacterium]|nr:hypothetical protein [Chloroflexota bacterium]